MGVIWSIGFTGTTVTPESFPPPPPTLNGITFGPSPPDGTSMCATPITATSHKSLLIVETGVFVRTTFLKSSVDTGFCGFAFTGGIFTFGGSGFLFSV